MALLYRFVFVLSLFISVAAAGQVPDGQPQAERLSRMEGKDPGLRAYYGYRGETAYLEMSTERIGVTFESDTDLVLAEAALVRELSLMPIRLPELEREVQRITKRKDVVPTRFPRRTTFLVDTVNVQEAGRLAGVVTRVDQDIAVASATPVYRVVAGTSEQESLLTEFFYVSVKASAEIYTEVESRFAAEGIEIAKKYDYSAIGKVGYRVRQSAAAKAETGLDAIALANRYHEDPRVLSATPSFIPLYSMQTAVAAPDDTYWRPSSHLYGTPLPTSPSDHDGAWNLEMMNILEAWETVYGSSFTLGAGPKVTIAIVDDGVSLNYRAGSISGAGVGSYSPAGKYEVETSPTVGSPNAELGVFGHDDLNDNRWVNELERLGTSGVDDDNNGKVDDFFGWDFVGNDPTMSGDEDNVPYSDYNDQPLFQLNRFHGTSAAGVAAAKGKNSLGTIGVAPDAKIMPVRYHVNTYVFDATDVWYVAHAENAINYAAGKDPNVSDLSPTHADVIAFMFASYTYDPGLHAAIQLAVSRNIPVFLPASNGNESLDSRPMYPQVLPEVICVGAIDENDERAHFPYPGAPNSDSASNYGFALDFVTPSQNRTIADYERIIAPVGHSATFYFSGATPTSAMGTYRSIGGTSAAMPQAAGVAALMIKTARARNLTLGVFEIYDILARSARDIDREDFDVLGAEGDTELIGEGRDIYTGWGLIDAAAAVEEATKTRFQVFGPQPAIDGTSEEKGPFQFSIDCEGYTVVSGLVEEVDSGEYATKLVNGASDEEWLVYNSYDQVVARLVPDVDERGARLYLRGTFYEDVSSISTPAGNTLIFDHYIPGAPPTREILATIEPDGDFRTLGTVFEMSDVDAVQTFTVGPTSSGADYEGASGIQDAIDDTTNIPNTSIIEVLPGTYSPITFPTGSARNLVIRSTDPNDPAVVASTIISYTGGGNSSVIVMGGLETEASAIMGFTIKGGQHQYGSGLRGSPTNVSPNVSRARIQFNHFVDNVAPGAVVSEGGAIYRHAGLIFGNVFGDGSAGGNVATYGGATASCTGTLQNNIFWYNGDTTTARGGAIYQCTEVLSNFIAFNEADEGAGMYFGGDEDCGNVAVVRGNLVFDNEASVAGGGIYGPRGRLENNTIYGNDAPDGAGIYSDWWPSSPCTDYVLQNLILWANSDGGSLGTQIEGDAAPYIVHSAIDATTNPGDSTNLGRWGSSSPILASGANGPDFLSTTFNTGSPNWSTFLHLDDSSPLIDRGQPDVGEYSAEVKSAIPTAPLLQYVFQQDFDGQVSPIDISGVGTVFDTGADPDYIPMDIGADEYPTEVATFHYWWQAHE